MNQSDKTVQEQAKGRFRKGQSGNPKGRPPGSRNKGLLVLEALIDGAADEVVQSVIDRAKKGDIAAARLILERLIPPCKDRPVQIDLSALDNAAGVLKASEKIIAAVATGQINPSEGHAMQGLLKGQRKILETVDLEQRLAKLEQLL